MTTFAFCSLVSPGVTTSVLALAHQWPNERPITVVDCAPSGGVIAQRLGLDPDCGLISLAARVRAEALSPSAIRQAALAAGGVSVVGAPTSGRSVVAALIRLGSEFVDALKEVPGDVLIDCGRVAPASPALPIIRRAHRKILVSRATPTELDRVRADAQETLGDDASFELLLIGEPGWRWPRAHTANDRHHDATAVAQKLEIPVAGVLGHDPRGAARVGFARWWLDRTYIVRTARQAATDMCNDGRMDLTADVFLGDAEARTR